MRRPFIVLAVMLSSAWSAGAQQRHQNAIIDLWAQGKPAFGVYAPNENPGPRGQRGQPPQPAVYTREGGEKLAMNPLYDFVFLNLEGNYDASAVKAMAEGLRSAKAVGRKTLIVRIPPIDKDGADAARIRVKEILGAVLTASRFRTFRTSTKRSRRSRFFRMRRRMCGRRPIPGARSSRC
jgi:hypothetical protein